jgi:hypothetical protein
VWPDSEFVLETVVDVDRRRPRLRLSLLHEDFYGAKSMKAAQTQKLTANCWLLFGQSALACVLLACVAPALLPVKAHVLPCIFEV